MINNIVEILKNEEKDNNNIYILVDPVAINSGVINEELLSPKIDKTKEIKIFLLMEENFLIFLNVFYKVSIEKLKKDLKNYILTDYNNINSKNSFTIIIKNYFNRNEKAKLLFERYKIIYKFILQKNTIEIIPIPCIISQNLDKKLFTKTTN